MGLTPPSTIPPRARQVDVWGIGCLAYELLVGVNTFHADENMPEDAVEARILSGEGVSFPSDVRISPDARAFIQVRAQHRPNAAHGAARLRFCGGAVQ